MAKESSLLEDINAATLDQNQSDHNPMDSEVDMEDLVVNEGDDSEAALAPSDLPANDPQQGLAAHRFGPGFQYHVPTQPKPFSSIDSRLMHTSVPNFAAGIRVDVPTILPASTEEHPRRKRCRERGHDRQARRCR